MTHGSCEQTEVHGADIEDAKGSPSEVKQQALMANKYSLLQAIGFNTMNMFGTGPLITIPYCLGSVYPQGPQAMLGYGIACIACSCDSFVWGEIGSMWPSCGGSYVYLRELYGFETWGRLASFMYIWQFLISGPAEVASGFVAIAEYMVYFSPTTLSYWPRVAISVGSLFFCAGLLHRKVDDVGRTTLIFWFITLFAIVFTLVAGFTDWHPSNLELPDGAFSGGFGRPGGKGIVAAVSAATRFGVYDMTGYYDVCFMGGRVQNPRRTIPISCISTCIIVGCTYILVYLAVLGHLPWQNFIDMYSDDYSGNPPGIMSLFTESRINKEFAYFFTAIVAITIFGSTYSMLCGFGYLPYAAAKDGLFFSTFAHESERHPGLADRSLILVVLLTLPWCFFSLDVVIDAMTTCLVLVQFVGQAVGLLYYRWRIPRTDQPEGWRMPLFPIPCIIQMLIFFFIWISSDSAILWDSEQPILEIAVCFLLLGPVVFFARSRQHQEWPFSKLDVEMSEAQGDADNHQQAKEIDKEAEVRSSNSDVPLASCDVPQQDKEMAKVSILDGKMASDMLPSESTASTNDATNSSHVSL